MAAIKYKDENGNWQLLNPILVKEIDVVQTTGTSSADVMSQSAVTKALSDKSDKASTVSNVSYNNSTGKLQQTINGTTTDVTDVVQSGFVPQFNSTTGIMQLNPVGSGTISADTTTGFIKITF